MECRRLIVHAGLHRTGTSSLQYQLPSMVPDHKVKVQVIDVDDRASLLGQAPLANLTGRLRLSDAADAPDLLISNEGLLGHFSNGYSDGRARATELRALLPRSSSTIPVVLFRPLVDWLESAYRASVQEGSCDLPEVFAERVLASPWSSWACMASDLTAEFAGHTPLLLPLFPGIDSTALLIDILELPRAAIQGRVPRLNASLSAIHTAWLRALNEESRFSPDDRDIIIDVMRRHLPGGGTRDTVFSPALRRHIAERSQREWLELLDLVGSGLGDFPAQVPAPTPYGEDAGLEYSGTITLGDPAMRALVALTRTTLIELNGRKSTPRQKLRDAARRLTLARA